LRTVKFTEFRNNASLYLNEVEKGEIIKITRHGKAIAEIMPPSSDLNKFPAWKKKRLRLAVKGKSISSAILEERETE
jgi:prevent-host-death family protein